MDIFFTVVLTFFGIFVPLLGARVLRNHLHESKLLRLREMIHKERLVALERDLPLPDDESDALTELLNGVSAQGAPSAESRAAKYHLIRLVALCLGLTSFLGGIGLTFGLHVQADTSVSGMWGIGLVPSLIGVGLLLFVRLSKNIEKSSAPARSDQ